MSVVVPATQRRPLAELRERLDIGDAESGRRSAFWLMLTLAGVIAVAGVAGDSTATVIGAMIVAPLSVPILGTGLGIASGDRSLVLRSVSTVLLGVALVIGIGFVYAQVLPNPTDVLANSQVVGRTSPKLSDLVAAFATGLVGVIALARKDVGDVLPGVAIAISLVPPLGVVGVCLGSGAPGLAVGALVLFASNVVAMIVTAVVVLGLTGYPAEAGARAQRRGRTYAAMVVTIAVVAAPMVVNSLSTLWASQIADAARTWLTPADGAQVTDVSVQGGTATVEVLAPADLPPVGELQESVDALIPWPVTVVVVHEFGTRLSG
ncbi:TIGR00341 family protein [Rhodococcus sp. HNM0569]|uniref:TIGR00341 family protein n=1 Tax=Rhodococcus sp. HNM0569 TaxID=2716340 RepID=UPI00146F4707|nr:TIGR00341 family protein [Rhodococcus sp. HNM0569]NLU84263.1 TIGR00341 family protein [Rhodococcus sp. HNM0569]